MSLTPVYILLTLLILVPGLLQQHWKSLSHSQYRPRLDHAPSSNPYIGFKNREWWTERVCKSVLPNHSASFWPTRAVTWWPPPRRVCFCICLLIGWLICLSAGLCIKKMDFHKTCWNNGTFWRESEYCVFLAVLPILWGMMLDSNSITPTAVECLGQPVKFTVVTVTFDLWSLKSNHSIFESKWQLVRQGRGHCDPWVDRTNLISSSEHLLQIQRNVLLVILRYCGMDVWRDNPKMYCLRPLPVSDTEA